MTTSIRSFAKAILLLAFISTPALASAASASTITLNGVGSDSSQITVYGDPDAPVDLYYGKNASQKSFLGHTGSNGYLTLNISTNSYSIACGNIAYVFVGGQRSTNIQWSKPGENCSNTSTSSGSGSVKFSETDIVMTVGQTRNISISGSSAYTVTDVSSPIISATMNGSSVTLYARGFGGAGVTVCDNQNKCSVLYVVALHSIPTKEVRVEVPGTCPAVTQTPVSTPNTSTSNFKFTLFLTVGDEGAEVTELQKKLTSLGHYSGPVTGYYGSLTRAAVIKFQKANGIDQAGYVGPGTRAALNK